MVNASTFPYFRINSCPSIVEHSYERCSIRGPLPFYICANIGAMIHAKIAMLTFMSVQTASWIIKHEPTELVPKDWHVSSGTTWPGRFSRSSHFPKLGRQWQGHFTRMFFNCWKCADGPPLKPVPWLRRPIFTVTIRFLCFSDTPPRSTWQVFRKNVPHNFNQAGETTLSFLKPRNHLQLYGYRFPCTARCCTELVERIDSRSMSTQLKGTGGEYGE